MKIKLRTLINNAHEQELISGASWALIIRMFGLLVGYLFMLLASRLLGAEAWGSFILSLAVVRFAAILGRLGLDTALLRLVAASSTQSQKNGIVHDAYKISVSVVIPVSVILAAILFLSANQLSTLIFHKPQLADSFRIISFAVLPICLAFLSAQSLRGLKKIRKFVFLDQVAPFFFSLVLFHVFYVYSKNPIIITYSFVGSTYLVAFISVVWMWKALGSEEYRSTQLVSYHHLFSIALPLLLAGSIQFVKQWVDILMLGVLTSEYEVGVYSVALNFAMLVSVPLLAIDSIAAPKFAESYASGDRDGLGYILKKSTQLVFFMSTPVLLFILFAGRTLLGFSGPEFATGITVLLILSSGQYINAITGSVGYFLEMTGEQVFVQNITIVTAIAGIILNYVLISWLGLTGAALATFTAVVIWNFGCVLYIKKKFGVMSIYLPFVHTIRHT